MSKKEVVMTLEQAKAAKLAKGFALEPVRPGALDATGPLPEKRERKKADIFGGSRADRRAALRPVPRFCASFRGISLKQVRDWQGTRISRSRGRKSTKKISPNPNPSLSMCRRKGMA